MATLGICLFILTTACKKDKPPGNEGPGVVSMVQGEADLSLFSEALTTTGLASDLSGGTYTVFAPTDTAFRALLSDLNVTTMEQLINRLGKSQVKNMLRYHILSGKSLAFDQFQPQFETTLATNSIGSGLNLRTDPADSSVWLNGQAARLEMGSLKANNGTLHKINKVLTLPTIGTLLPLEPGFNTFLKMLTAAQGNLATFYYQENKKLSLLVPTNAGFQKFFNDQSSFTDFSGFQQTYGPQGLADIVNYHTLTGAIGREDFESKPYPSLLNGKVVFISIAGNEVVATDAGGQEAAFTEATLSAINGEVHAVDYVLLPN